MKKILIFMATLCMMIVLSVSVYASASERTWCFTDSEFSSLEDMWFLKDDVTINGLTISKGIEVNISNSKKRNVWFDKSLYMPENSDTNSGYLKFYVNGNTDIHIFGASKSDTEARNITIYSDATKKSANVLMFKTDDYKYEYRGSAGYIYLYTSGKGVRIYSVTAKDYNASEYTSMKEGEKKSWDFGAYYSQYSSINQNTNINGLMVYANASETISCAAHSTKGKYGDEREGYLDLSGTGTRTGRYISFPVPENSDIYISAKSSSNKENRTMLVRNKYYGLPSTNLSKKLFDSEDVECSYMEVGGTVDTYKISYYGTGEDFVLSSLDSGIRIYRIIIVPRIYKSTEAKEWNISSSNFAVGSYPNNTIDSLGLYNTVIESCNINGYTKRACIHCGVYQGAGKLKIKVSDSSGTRGDKTKRTISVTANTSKPGTLLIAINSGGYVLGSYVLGNDIKDYTFDYNGTYDEINIYTFCPENRSSEYSYIYKIDNGKTKVAGPNDIEQTIDVVKGQSYRYFITCNNIGKVSAFKYSVIYNSDAITIKKAGENPTTSIGYVYCDSSMTDVSNVNGVFSFKLNNNSEQWSGILCPIEFVAESTGKTTIKIIAEPQYN